MSTANFKTMEHFPLYVVETDVESFRCVDCGIVCYEDDEDGVCPECGGRLESFADDWLSVDFMQDIQPALDDLNYGLSFHHITVRSGYYTGLQLYVAVEHQLDEYDYDDDDCWYYFGMSRSAAHCKFFAERVKVCKAMERIAQDYGMRKLNLVGVFSNGEAVYEYA